MNYKFVLIDATDGSVERFWILTPPVTVGRCPTADITIGDASISRKHCQFHIDPHGSLVVRDLGSKNGIYVDERRVDKAIVRPGAEVRIGLITLRPELTDAVPDVIPPVREVFDLGETQAVKIILPDGESPNDGA